VGGVARYEVTVIVGQRQTFVVEAADQTEAREKCERGEEPLESKYPHKDEVFVVEEPVLTEIGLGDPAAEGLRKLIRRPNETETEAYGRVFGDVAEGEQGDPEGPT
jgi:hypothetical protein